MSRLRLKVGSDNALEMWNLRDQVTGATISDATVTTVLYDASGVAISGGNITLATVSGISGGYRGTLPYTVALVKDQTGFVRFSAVKGSYRRVRDVDFVAEVD